MISDILLQFLFEFLSWGFRALPDFIPLPASVDSSFDYFLDLWAVGNSLLPLNDVFAMISFVVSLEAGIFLFRLVEFIYNKVRGSG